MLAEPLQFLWEPLDIPCDKVILDLVEAVEPERGDLVQHRALVWNRVGQDHVKRRDAIRDYKEQRLAEIKDFAHLPATQLPNSGKID